jgi:hypothetical protein
MCHKRHTCLLQIFCSLILTLLLCGCVGKKPDDDVALIKVVLTKFERGIDLASQAVLDSVVLDKKQNVSSELLDSLSMGRKLIGGKIAKKSFVIIKDSAEVKLRLSLQYSPQAEEPEEIEKPVTLTLYKKSGKWKIRSFSMTSEVEKPEGD